MKITIINVDGRVTTAEEQLQIILKDALERYKEEGNEIEDVKLEEVSATFSMKPKGSEAYFVGSVEHDGFTEMFAVNFDLNEREREDNLNTSFFAEDEKEVVAYEEKQFEEIRSVFDEDDLEQTDTEILGDMAIFRYEHSDGYEVVRVFQNVKGTQRDILIQEYSIKPKETAE